MRTSELNFRQLLDYYGIVIAKDDGNKGTILCQFHEDHRPSCSIDFTKNLYYCFPCSEGGSIINFVMGKENLDYAGAVAWLSEFYGDKVEVAGVDYHSAMSKRAKELANDPYIWSYHLFIISQLDLVLAKYPTEELQRAELEKEIYKSLVKQKHEEIDRGKFPDKWFWKDMSILIEDYLWALECKWRDRLPWEKFSMMAQATEETYFDYWDEEIDRFATEKMLLKEVKRITERLLWRTEEMLTGDSKRLAEKAKRIMIDWLGLLKGLSLDGQILPKAYLISETGCQYGGTA
jgi:hypothetical protein